MRYTFIRTLLGAALLGGMLIVPASAAVYSPQHALPSQAVQQFLSDPGSLLTQYPNGGPQLINAVRDLAASDPQTLNALISLLKTANPDQSTSIGTALGQVAQLAVNSDQAYATSIQTAVVSSGNTSAEVAFSAVVGGNIKLTATGPGGGGGGGGGGESATGSNSGGGGVGFSSPLDLHTFNGNTPDSFTTTTFSPGSAGTPNSVSASTP